MKKVKNTRTQTFCLLVLMVLAGVAQAQNKKVIFSNNNQQADIVGNASINVSTGDITVQTQDDKLIIDADTTGILAFYPDEYLINAGDGVVLNWASAYTTGCTASVVSGNANWSGSKSHNIMDSQTVTINSVPTTLSLECDQVSGGTIDQQFTISQLPTGSTGTTGNIAINFNLKGQSGSNPTIAGDGQYTVVWSTSNADSCTASSSPLQADWNGSVILNNPTNGKVVNISGSPTLTLTCSNNSGQNSANLVFNNTGSGGGNPVAGCENVTQPSGMLIKQHNWNNQKPSQNFIANQNEGYGTPYINLDSYGVHFAHNEGQQYLSLSDINIPTSHGNFIDNHLYSRITFGYPTTSTGEFTNAIVSMSECAGDFDTSKTAACLLSIRASNGMVVTTDPNSEHTQYFPEKTCVVEKGKSYFLNFFSGEDTGAVSTPAKRSCVPYGGKCGVLLKVDITTKTVF